MKRFITALTFFLFIFSFRATSFIGEWKTFTSKREVKNVAYANGKIWAATTGGAFSFQLSDSAFKEFTTSEGLRSVVLTAVVATSRGEIFFGSNNGVLHRYSIATKEWRYDYALKEFLEPVKTINRLQIVGDTLLISSEIGLSLFSLTNFRFGDTYRIFGSGFSPKVGKVNAALYANGKIFVATSNGIAVANTSSINLTSPDEWEVFTMSEGLPSNTVLSLAKYGTVVYAVTANGIAMYDGNLWTTIAGTLNSSFLEIRNVNDSLFALTPLALYQISSANILTPVKIFSGTIATTFCNAGNEFFVGTNSRGILLHANDFYYPEGPVTNHFFYVAVDKNSTVWSSTTYDAGSEGIHFYNRKHWKNFNSVYPYPSYRVNIGSNNTIWQSTWGGGIAVLNANGTFDTIFTSDNGLPLTTNHQTSCQPFGGSSFSIPLGAMTVGNDTTWVASRTPLEGKKILTAFCNKKIVRTVPFPIDECHKFTDCTIDMNGVVWFSNTNFIEPTYAKDNDLYFYSTKHSITGGGLYGSPYWGKVTKDGDGLLSSSIYCTVSDNDGNLWVGTDYGINIIYNTLNPKNSIAPYTPLRDTKITAIAVDPLNNKWVATPQGIYHLSSDGLTRLGYYTVENTDGKLVNNDVLSVAVDGNNGIVYFGTTDGLSSFKISAVTPKKKFTEISVAPNPFLLPSNIPVTISGLIANVLIKIISVDGELIKELPSTTSENPGGGIALWDGVDKNGNIVASGIYFIIASDEQGNNSAVGKIAVVRK